MQFSEHLFAALAWRRQRRARMRQFDADMSEFRRRSGSPPRLSLDEQDVSPYLDDSEGEAAFDRQYFYHLAWAARVLAETRPVRHTDISSQVQFCAAASAFIPIDYYEFHPPRIELDNLTVNTVDLCRLPFSDGSIASLSCMHVVEHVGLGRYGDELDPDGDLKAARELCRVLAPGGQLLIVVPVGRPRIAFNAHRVYGFHHVTSMFEDLRLVEFALIPDGAGDGGLLRNSDPEMVAKQEYACGCFRFVKQVR